MEKSESDSESTFEEDNTIIDNTQQPHVSNTQQYVSNTQQQHFPNTQQQHVQSTQQPHVQSTQQHVSNIQQHVQSTQPTTNEHKLRQLLTQIDIKDYDLKNPSTNQNYSNFGKKKSYLVEKNVEPLKVYIYGDYQHYQKSAVYFMFRKAGVTVNRRLNEVCDVGLLWDPRIDIDKQTPKLKQNSKKVKMINLFLKDTSKDYIAIEFEKHFGYSYRIDPLVYDGYCMGKHNGNGTKSCFFLKCPINANEIFKDHSYQKIIDYTDKNDSNILYELRVPIVGGIIPCVLFKTRNRGLRFTSKNRSIQIVKPTEYLTENECNKIITFCSSIGLEFGEIDILRSNETGKIYIIDVNNTSWWPPNKLGDIDRNIVLNLMWNSFLEAFLPHHYKNYHIPDNLIDDFMYSNSEKNDRSKVLYKYKDNRFTRNKYKMAYKVTWRKLYNNENDENNENDNENNENNENDNENENKNENHLKMIQEHTQQMNKLLKKNPHLKKMFINEKTGKENKEKELKEKEKKRLLQIKEKEKNKLLQIKEKEKNKLLQIKQKQEEIQNNKKNEIGSELFEQFQEFLKFKNSLAK